VTAGQIVTFTAPTPDHPVVSHRVVQVVTRGGSVAVRTRGDANSADDPWEIALDQSTVWHTVAVVPAVGGAISFLHNNGIRVFAVWVLPALLCADILWRLWRRPRLEVPAA
jgi:signal peptidase